MQLDRDDQHEHDGDDCQLGSHGMTAAPVDMRQRRGQLVAARHRQRRAGDTGDQVEQHTERGDRGTDPTTGAAPIGEPSTTALSGASLPASTSIGVDATAVTPTIA